MFRNVSIVKRLILLIGVMALALIVNAIIGWHGYHEVNKSLDKIYEGGVEEVLKLATLLIAYESNITEVVQKIRDDQMNWAEGEEKIKKGIEQTKKQWTSYSNNIKSMDQSLLHPDTMMHLEAMQDHMERTNVALRELQEIIRRRDKQTLSSFATQDLYPLFNPLIEEIHSLIDLHVSDTKKDYQFVQSTLLYNQFVRTIIVIVALVIAVIIAAFIVMSITKPLEKAIRAIKQAASGDLAVQIENNTTNEMGILLEATKKMVDSNKKIAETLTLVSKGEVNLQVEPRSEKDTLAKSLNEMVDSSKKMSEILTALAKGDLTLTIQPRSDRDVLGLALASMTKKLRQMIGDIQSDIVSLNTSSQEIIVSISQVAAGSSETAASVAETTTTVEELKQTAQISAEKAKEVLTSAEETLEVVKNSEKSLQETIKDMEQINEKMRNISTGIIKLSELGQTIGQIIDTVNDLAEQSNLLAVNAAIEAAKAGEQGKGFSVVAQEIRTLAEQSKAATIQIRAILNDIQNATSAAVLATEQGSKAVDKGVAQSLQTNESMRILLEYMVRVIQAANQIAISSQQQLIGIDQVTVAMNSINEAANQHAENMKKIENAILALNSIGKTLKQIIDYYHLEEIHPFEKDRYHQSLMEKKGEGSFPTSSDQAFSLSSPS